MAETEDERRKRLLKVVDETGFGFQLAAAETARATGLWGVQLEAAWRDDEQAGYADLVLRSQGILHLVVECKRTFIEWVFLIENEREDDVTDLRGFWTDVAPNEGILAGWEKMWITPRTARSQFCAFARRGQQTTPSDARHLEQLASMLVSATQAIATDTISAAAAGSLFWIPVILTTARLFVVRGCSSKSDLRTGHIAADDIVEVPLVRFHKTLSLKGDTAPRNLTDLLRIRAQSERTVFVCQAEYWPTLLRQLSADLFGCKLPWEAARERWRRDRNPLVAATPILPST